MKKQRFMRFSFIVLLILITTLIPVVLFGHKSTITHETSKTITSDDLVDQSDTVVTSLIPSVIEPSTLPVVSTIVETNTMKVSCYTGWENHGANGRTVDSAASLKYPQGTKLMIPGLGEFVVRTVTSKEFKDRVDIWFGESYEDYQRCREFGVKQMQIHVIED